MLPKIILILLIFIFTSCSNNSESKLKISTTTWIGYTPLIYANEKGWLEPLNIKLVHVSSLAENLYLYQAGNSDAFVGTQYEYNLIYPQSRTLKPIMMLDRSNGGDLVMSNLSIEKLKSTKKNIHLYLEMDSINNTILKDFLRIHKLEDKKLKYHNKTQAEIKLLKKTDEPIIIVTYTPYDFELEKQGFNEIASTKDSLDLLVIDALYTKQETLKKHREQFVRLKQLVDKSIENLHRDPKEFYEVIGPYLEDISYEDFIHSLNDIVWINKKISKDLKLRLEQSNYSIDSLL